MGLVTLLGLTGCVEVLRGTSLDGGNTSFDDQTRPRQKSLKQTSQEANRVGRWSGRDEQ